MMPTHCEINNNKTIIRYSVHTNTPVVMGPFCIMSFTLIPFVQYVLLNGLNVGPLLVVHAYFALQYFYSYLSKDLSISSIADGVY